MTTSDNAHCRPIELLAPAKNLECGLAAIEHGADAVYIGAESFGARAAAGNSIDDIRTLCERAHVFGARVYVTVNTIVYEHELARARLLMQELSDIGVDAFLIQDMGLLNVKSSFHASTQTDNRTAEKVRWLRDKGFSRVVLARELSVEEIEAIHKAVPDVELEVFVHGALCVSYSGLCYASQYCFGRSANRGECAQFCRLKFDLQDADGRMVERGRHLLSLKDLCQIDALEELLQAGASSLKIEGRLKDAVYVKNVVAAYSQRLNEIIGRHPNLYRRASRGRCHYAFQPDLKKTFNRGFTHYFLHGRQPDMGSPDTPKAIGEYVGKVKWIHRGELTVAGTANFANGDGLCFMNDKRELEGFRVNRVEKNRLFPLRMPQGLRPGMALYRNNDQEFERQLSKKSAERKMVVDMVFERTDKGFRLSMRDAETGVVMATAETDFERQEARKPQRENICQQLSKLGGTPYECRQVEINGGADGCFVPSSLLGTLRQTVVASAIEASKPSAKTVGATSAAPQSQLADWSSLYAHRPYLFNIANSSARTFYEREGLKDMEPAFELQKERQATGQPPLLMQCRYCLRYAWGFCVKHGGRTPQWREPLSLMLPDGRRFRLQFDCSHCQMNVYAETGK